MNYTAGISGALLLLSGAIAGCGGGTTGNGDAGFDASPFGEDGGQLLDSNPPGSDSEVADAFVATDTGVSVDTGSLVVDMGPTSVDTGVGADGGCVATLGALGRDCGGASDAPCPAGFTCHTDSGIVAHSSCQILCGSAGSSCPCETSCSPHADKGSTWMQCDQL